VFSKLAETRFAPLRRTRDRSARSKRAPEIATGNLDIAINGQLPPPKFALGDEFEPGSVEMVGFEAPFRRGGLWEQDLEHAPGNANDAFIFAHADAELDGVPVGVPSGVGRKAEERCSLRGLEPSGNAVDPARC
jgi:hypothetical protein